MDPLPRGPPGGRSELAGWLDGRYEPLPGIVDAARLLFQRLPLPFIRRAHSFGIPETVTYVLDVYARARAEGRNHLVLLTGVPGAGKTLVGLQVVHSDRLQASYGPSERHLNPAVAWLVLRAQWAVVAKTLRGMPLVPRAPGWCMFRRERMLTGNGAMRRPRIISLYTGAGGLDYGLEAAGFETAVAVEFDADSAETLRRNRSWPVLERDIHDIPSKEILEVAGLEEGEADLLAGGPPCQPFSKSGYWAKGDAGRLDDPRASTLDAYLRVLRDTKPRAFLLENVAGLAYQRKDEGLEFLRRTILHINDSVGTSYSFVSALLNAADYGVPQERERFFIVGEREGANFVFPKPTHESEATHENGKKLLLTEKRELYRTAWDAIGDLEDDDDSSLRMTGKWAELLPSIPEGENYLFHTERGGGLPLFGWRRRYWSFLLKLSKRLPSWTVTAQPGSAIGPFHWKNRRLSVRELCRLQTFPDDIQVFGSRSSYQRQVGNAVPSALAQVLGIEILRMLGHRVPRQVPTLVPPRRTPIPPRERVRKVPEKYRHLAGDHEAHPGTGLGYGALSRARVERV